ncbi:6-phosphofructokinase, partial [Streptococcus salivarius]|uniref:6-phosphofructokinase n=1 Tax=Streptococcus salivarius TaxID=1304 RepID=UPI0034A1DAB7
DYTIGFDTSVATATEAIDKIQDTAFSHGRTFVVEVMGRHAGDIALWAGIASGADQIIVPEEEYDINEVVRKVKEGYESGVKTHHVIVLAEGVMGAEEFAAKMKEAGDTSDLRATNIGHVVRGGSPTARDRVLASWMGAHAVDLLKQGIGGVAVGIHNEQLVESPILGTAEEGALFSLTEDGKIIVNNPHKARLDFADLNRSLSNLS